MNEPTIDEKVSLLGRRFCHQWEVFAFQWWHKENQRGGYTPVREGPCLQDPPCGQRFCRHRATRPMRKRDLVNHIKGQETLGVYQLGKDDTVGWVVLDVDVNKELVRQARLDQAAANANAQRHARDLARVLQGYGLPFLVEGSGSKGYHLWLFFEEPVPAAKAMAFGRWVNAQAAAPAGIAVEVFPKQVGRSSFGSLVKIPLGVHKKTGKRCLFVGPSFEPLPDQWGALASVGTLTEEDLDELIDEHGMEIPATVRVEDAHEDGIEPKSTLPCMTKLMRVGVGKGMRDEAAFKLGCYLRSRGVPQEMAEGAMGQWNEVNDPPMEDGVLREKIASAYRGAYSPFPCSNPMFDHLCSPDCFFFASKERSRRRDLNG